MFGLLRLLAWPIIIAVPALIATIIDAAIWPKLLHWFLQDPLSNSLWILTALWALTAVRHSLRYSYALWQSRKLIALRIILPRNDSKLDQEKRTEKDFKEKVAMMEQLYRTLWEVKSLTAWDSFVFWITNYITISFEMIVEKGQLTFYVITQPKFASIVEKQVTSFYTDAEVVVTKPPDIRRKGQKVTGYNMTLRKAFMYPIRFYEQMQDDPLNGMTNVLSKLAEDEVAAVQVVLRPARTEHYNKKTKNYATQMFKGAKTNFLQRIPGLNILSYLFWAFSANAGTKAPGATSGDSYVRMIQPEEELYKRMGEKGGMSFYEASVRILATTKTWQRGLEVTNNLQVAFNAYKDTYGNYFVNRRMYTELCPLFLNGPMMEKLFRRRLNGYHSKPCILTEKELAGLYHFPDSRYNKGPIILWSTYKVLAPPPDAPADGIIIGKNEYRGNETTIRFRAADRTRHHYIIGKSGTGKSAFISWMARQDIAHNDGLCVVDPHGDLVEDCLAHTPKARAKDVVVFDPADIERPMGLNILEAKTDEEKDRAALDAMEIFIKLFGNEIFGPRIQHYFRNGCLTLMDDEEEGATLIDVPRLFVDDEFQKYKVSKCRNPVVRTFWEHEIAKTGAREKEEMIPYFSAKFGPFITNTTMRNIIGQPKSAFNVRQIMDEGKVLLVNLSKGKIGDTNAQLLGLIFVNKINMAALSRADVPREQRKRFYLYVDEFQNFVTDAFATILSEARKYELALIMAHQYIGQLVGKTSAYGESSSKMRDAVFGNVGTICSFKIGAEDAEYMAKEMAPVLSEQDVIGIPNFHCYVKLNINNVTSRPFNMQTMYDESDRNEAMAKLIKEYSRLKYGRKKSFVDQEIEDRIGIV